MRKVGITGQSGFMGQHLYNYLKSMPDDFELVDFEDAYFSDDQTLAHFVKRCDTIVHLAAMNRHGEPQVIYDTNIRLVKQLISALEKNNHTPHVLFSSSTQEVLDNMYGKSKKDGRDLLVKWARESKAVLTGLVIPNVFGPFGNPHYNSVIATFSHLLCNGGRPEIHVDSALNLIYINDLVEFIAEKIVKGKTQYECIVPSTVKERKVSEILEKLKYYKKSYFEENVIPKLENYYDVSLFNTFRSYIPYEHYPVYLVKNADNRGHLEEIIKTNTSGQIFYSETNPGITRGEHFHRRKIERFCVVYGDAIIRLRKIGTDKIIEYKVSGDEPSTIDIPILHAHNITNIGTGKLITLFWTNEFYTPDNPDTFFEMV